MHSTPMRFGLRISWVAISLTASLPLSVTAAAQPPAVSRESLAGEYSANQMEVTARLLLQPNGHFQYELAYGALDEIAEGTWDIQGSSVFLTTVPTVNPPRFEVLGYQLNQYGILNIRLDNFPIMKGASQRVYLIYGPNEPREMVEVAADGNVPLPGNRLPTAFIPVIPGCPITLKPICLTRTPGIVGATGTTARMGHFITLRFDKNDLGKADFHPQVLIIANGVLVMTRPDLRLMLNFKREPSR